MSGVAFTWNDAKRIAGAVQWAEGQKGLIGGGIESSPLRPGESWVRTPASLPGGYDGTNALEGVGILRLADGTDHDLNTVWIKDPNDAPLAADTVYRGTFNGTLSQAGSNYPLFLVQAGGAAATAPATYKIAGYYGATLPYDKTPVKFLDDDTTYELNGRPWGDDVKEAFFSLNGVYPYPAYAYSYFFQAMVNKSNGSYYLIQGPTVMTYAKYVGVYGLSNIVRCQQGSQPLYGYFYAYDHLQLVPTNGSLKKVLLAMHARNPQDGVFVNNAIRKIGWRVINYQTTDPFLVGGQGAGVALPNGGAFPSGMGGGFATPTTGTGGVE